MIEMLIALETYTIRKEMRLNRKAAFTKVHDQGIDHVELTRTSFDEDTLLDLKETKLKVVSIQVKLNKLETSKQKLVDFLLSSRADIAVVSVMPTRTILGGKRAVLHLAKRLEILAESLSLQGIRLAYHNHDFEFRKVSGKTKFDWLLENTGDKVHFVLDVYWTKKHKEDPLYWLKKIGNRLIGLHLRDCSVDGSNTEVGSGTVDFPRLFAEAPANVIYGAIEQNSRDPFTSIKVSHGYLQKIHPEGGKK